MLEVLTEDAKISGWARDALLSLAGAHAPLRRLIDDPAGRVFLSPGLFLPHLHAETAGDAGPLHAAGVTSWTLAAYGRSREEILAAARTAAASPLARSPGFRGLMLEGPFICGGERARATSGMVRELIEALPLETAALVFAPECVVPDEFLAALGARDIEPVVGYTRAGYEGCLAVFRKGARGLCLPFISTAPLHHRYPGPIGAAGEGGAWVEAPLGLEDFTPQRALFLAAAFGGRVRPVYHPAAHPASPSAALFPSDFAQRAAAMLAVDAAGFLSLARPERARDGTFVLFDEKLAVLAAVVDGKPEFMA